MANTRDILFLQSGKRAYCDWCIILKLSVTDPADIARKPYLLRYCPCNVKKNFLIGLITDIFIHETDRRKFQKFNGTVVPKQMKHMVKHN